MEGLQLRKTMGGYKREDVTSYVDALVKKYEAELSSARESLSAARAETAAALSENAKLFDKVRELEGERDSVSRAVISAEREAEKILAEAREKAAALLLKKETELSAVSAKKAALEADIHTLRLAAAAALRRYEGALAALSVEDADEE